MIELQETADGIILPVRASAGARRNAIAGVRDGSLRIQVTQQPENGKANAAIAKLLAKELKIAKSRVQLISGATNSKKRFLIVDVTPDTIMRLLET